MSDSQGITLSGVEALRHHASGFAMARHPGVLFALGRAGLVDVSTLQRFHGSRPFGAGLTEEGVCMVEELEAERAPFAQMGPGASFDLGVTILRSAPIYLL